MKHLLILLLSLQVALTVAAADACVPDRVMHYDVSWRFGLISINAGHADIAVCSCGDHITATFNGHSVPLHGTVYAVSDTLVSDIYHKGGLSEESVSYVNGWYMKPTAAQARTGSTSTWSVDGFKNTRGEGTLNANPETMQAVATTANMLELIYYFNKIDFASLKPGTDMNLDIYNGNDPERNLVMKYFGPSQYNGRDTYLVSFVYQFAGDKRNYPTRCQIDKLTRIPLQFSSNIKIGHVEMNYSGNL